MQFKKPVALAAAIAAFGVLCAAPALANQNSDRNRDKGGFVTPCSLDGVNPVHHPEVFANPAVAAQYGFVLGPGGVWHVRPDCRR